MGSPLSFSIVNHINSHPIYIPIPMWTAPKHIQKNLGGNIELLAKQGGGIPTQAGV